MKRLMCCVVLSVAGCGPVPLIQTQDGDPSTEQTLPVLDVATEVDGRVDLESDGDASRIFGPKRASFASKLDSGHGFDVPTGTRASSQSKLLVRLTKYGYQRISAVARERI